MRCNSVVRNKEHDGENQTLSKQRKYQEKMSKLVILGQIVEIRKVRVCFSLIDLTLS